jgi:hypothetical protein
MSLSPTRIPPKTIKNMSKYCNLLKLFGNFNVVAIIKIKKTINFLNAIKAAKGITVTQ